jgi:brefeldin A-inhibited guanine nucleotide-exchange protein
MIQALRNMIALLTYYFRTLERMLDGFLELLVTCIDQDNDTVSRIGSSCLLQLVVDNVGKLTPQHWHLIVDKIESLFESTTAQELLDGSLIRESTSMSEGANASAEDVNGVSNPKASTYVKRPAPFRKTIVKCVLQLLMIETVDELLSNEQVQTHLPITEVLRISKRLRSSYMFAWKFNGDRETRRRLHQLGFMQQTPNLLKQQWTAAMTYVRILFRLYRDRARLGDPEQKKSVETELVPTTCGIIKDYNQLDPGERRAMETSWPIVAIILNEYCDFDDADFKTNVVNYYPHIIGILNRDMVADLRLALQRVLTRIGEVCLQDPGVHVRE